ncbi:LuxR C-terminal-related transcriptional regulator [Sediminibacillus massiliensis]|uniref:LuxR C-terminal-related transcriptional regulator n=1 Tax=Sediminibacillus massiliensis TaxID=1926277 RepID=UPI002481C185|nr:LuxR C-terminal-related transcriptional regulator [Sediminibacillus massiliensis]
MTQAIELLADLQQMYASQFDLTVMFTDSSGELLLPAEGENLLCNTLLQQEKINLLDEIKRSLREEWKISKPVVYDVLPGIHIIVAPVPGSGSTYFLWAGVMIEEQTQNLVKELLLKKIEVQTSLEEIFKQTPRITKERKKQWIQRTGKLAELAGICLQEEEKEFVSGLPGELLQEAVDQDGMNTSSLLSRFFANSEEFDFLGIAEPLDEDTYKVTKMVGKGTESFLSATFSPGEGFLGRTLLTGQPAHWDNVEKDPRSQFFRSFDLYPMSLFCEPVKHKRDSLSVLFGGSMVNKRLSGKEKALGKTLAILLEVSMSVQTLRLENNQQLNRLTSLVDICKLMASTPDLKRILYILVDISINLVEGPFSFVLLKEGEKVKLVSRGSGKGDLQQYAKEIHERYEYFSKPIFSEAQAPNLFTTKAGDEVIECPLFHGKELLGILCVGIRKQSAGQLKEHLAFLHTLSIIGGVSLQLTRQGDIGTHEEKVEVLHRAVGQFDPDMFAVAEQVANLSAEFTTNLGLKPALVKDIIQAGQLSFYCPDFIREHFPGSKVPEILEKGKAYGEKATFQESSGEEGARIYALIYTYVMNEHNLQAINHLKDLDKELYEQFVSFVQDKQIVEQEFTPSTNMNSREINSLTTAVKERVKLSPREQEVLMLVMEGLNNKEIAEELFISDHTVKNHVTKIFQKLGVSDRANAISKVYQLVYQ